MKNLIIVGAGGLGREVHNMIPDCIGYGTSFILKGFINDMTDALGPFDGYAPIIGTIRDYIPQQDDVFACAIGDIHGRKQCVELLLSKGAEFITLIHRSAISGRNSRLGQGCILGRSVSVSCDCFVGDFSILQAECLVGHDVQLGRFCQLHPRVFVAGQVKIGNEVHIGACAMIHPGKNIGDSATVGAGAFVIRNVTHGQTVFGNPAKVLK